MFVNFLILLLFNMGIARYDASKTFLSYMFTASSYYIPHCTYDSSCYHDVLSDYIHNISITYSDCEWDLLMTKLDCIFSRI